jgi:hypothetical protein
VATDPSTKSSLLTAEHDQAPVIENELPTYRAVSTAAVLALICGAMASFSFAGPEFLGFAVLAVVLGVWADRRIQQRSDMLTGRGLAQAGLALGLTFGLISVTYATVQGYIRTRDASQFATQYAQILREGDLGEILWYGTHPDRRKNLTPKGVLEQLQAKSNEPNMLDMKAAPVKLLKARLSSSSEEKVSFDTIESHGLDGVDPFAVALFDVEGPGTKESPEPHAHAAAILKASLSDGKRIWWVEDFHFPYKPKSYVAPVKKQDDDGHGHPH